MVYSRFKFLLEEYALEAAEKVVVHGQIEGFYTLISVHPQSNLYYIMLGAHPGEKAANIVPFFEDCKQLPTIQSIEQQAAAIVITGKVSLKKQKMIQTIRHILDTFPEKLRKLGYETGDFKTGINDGSVKLTQFNEYYTYLSEENYYSTLEEVQEQQSQFTNKNENMLLGVVGAFIGASLGALLWFVIGLLGYFAWIAGILALFFAFKGYQIAGGKVSNVGAILVFILTISVVFLANHAVWAWTANDGYDQFYWYAFRNIHRVILSEPSIRMKYLLDVALGVGVISLIGIPFMRSLYKENASHYEVKRYD